MIEGVSDYADAWKKITLYIVKAGKGLKSRIPVNSKLPDHKVLFNLQWDTVKYGILDHSFALNRDERSEGLYYFTVSSDPEWTQSPFEFNPNYALEKD